VNHTVAYTTDSGVSWTGAGRVFSEEGLSVAFSGSEFIAVGLGTVTMFRSVDGISWTAVLPSPLAASPLAVAYNIVVNKFLAVDNNIVTVSDAGLNWTTTASSLQATFIGREDSTLPDPIPPPSLWIVTNPTGPLFGDWHDPSIWTNPSGSISTLPNSTSCVEIYASAEIGDAHGTAVLIGRDEPKDVTVASLKIGNVERIGSAGLRDSNGGTVLRIMEGSVLRVTGNLELSAKSMLVIGNSTFSSSAALIVSGDLILGYECSLQGIGTIQVDGEIIMQNKSYIAPGFSWFYQSGGALCKFCTGRFPDPVESLPDGPTKRDIDDYRTRPKVGVLSLVLGQTLVVTPEARLFFQMNAGEIFSAPYFEQNADPATPVATLRVSPGIEYQPSAFNATIVLQLGNSTQFSGVGFNFSFVDTPTASGTPILRFIFYWDMKQGFFDPGEGVPRDLGRCTGCESLLPGGNGCCLISSPSCAKCDDTQCPGESVSTPGSSTLSVAFAPDCQDPVVSVLSSPVLAGLCTVDYCANGGLCIETPFAECNCNGTNFNGDRCQTPLSGTAASAEALPLWAIIVIVVVVCVAVAVTLGLLINFYRVKKNSTHAKNFQQSQLIKLQEQPSPSPAYGAM
jgi:hypothetical protein